MKKDSGQIGTALKGAVGDVGDAGGDGQVGQTAIAVEGDRIEVAEVGGRWKVVLYGSAVMFVDKLEREGQTNEWIGAWLVFQRREDCGWFP